VTTSPPLERLSLLEEEHVQARGTSRTSWRVAKNDGWIRPNAVPGARVERLETAPGIVYRTRIELELPRGTRLLRVELRSEPEAASTFEHLTGTTRGARKRTRTSEYRVGAGGTLDRVERRSP